MSDKIETIRARHIRLGSQLGNRTTGLTAFEAEVAHQDRATLLAELDAIKARHAFSEDHLELRRRVARLETAFAEAISALAATHPDEAYLQSRVDLVLTPEGATHE